MSDRESQAKRASVRGARGAAREAIGKLIGDDTQVRKGRDEQRAADAAADTNNKEQE